MDAFLAYILRPDFILFIIAIIILILFFAYSFYIERKKRRAIRSAFSTYISSAVVEEIIGSDKLEKMQHDISKTPIRTIEGDEQDKATPDTPDSLHTPETPEKQNTPATPEPRETKAGDIRSEEPNLLEQLLEKEFKPRTEYHREALDRTTYKEFVDLFYELLKSKPRLKKLLTPELKDDKKEKSFNWYLLIRTCISLAVLGVALYIIIEGRHSDKSSEWAYGAVGTVIGYWLK